MCVWFKKIFLNVFTLWVLGPYNVKVDCNSKTLWIQLLCNGDMSQLANFQQSPFTDLNKQRSYTAIFQKLK